MKITKDRGYRNGNYERPQKARPEPVSGREGLGRSSEISPELGAESDLPAGAIPDEATGNPRCRERRTLRAFWHQRQRDDVEADRERTLAHERRMQEIADVERQREADEDAYMERLRLAGAFTDVQLATEG